MGVIGLLQLICLPAAHYCQGLGKILSERRLDILLILCEFAEALCQFFFGTVIVAFLWENLHAGSNLRAWVFGIFDIAVCFYSVMFGRVADVGSPLAVVIGANVGLILTYGGLISIYYWAEASRDFLLALGIAGALIVTAKAAISAVANTALRVALKRLTVFRPEELDSMGGIIYAVENVGSLIVSLVAMGTRTGIASIPTGNVVLMGCAMGSALLTILLVLLFNWQWTIRFPALPDSPGYGALDRRRLFEAGMERATTDSNKHVGVLEALRDVSLWRVIAFQLALTGFISVFRILGLIVPDLAKRRYGEHAPYALLWAVNSVIVIVVAPVAQILLRKAASLRVVIGGAVLGSAGLLLGGLLLLFTDSFYLILVAVAIFSVGEGIGSPRATTLVLKLAREGRAGLYIGIATIPVIATKLPVSLFSSFLLNSYCATAEACDVRPIFFWLAGSCFLTPLLLIILALSGLYRSISPDPLPGKE